MCGTWYTAPSLDPDQSSGMEMCLFACLDRWTYGFTGWIWIDRQTHRQIDGERERQTDRQIKRQMIEQVDRYNYVEI